VIIMKLAACGLLCVGLAWCFITPLPGTAQTLTNGTSPQLHAWFEYEYAREATSISLSKPHREQIVVITEALDNGLLSAQDASARINALLTPREKNDVLQIEESFRAALQAISLHAEEGQASKASASDNSTQADAGQFLLLLLHDSSSATTPTAP
jgi:hypothetical protein